MYGGAQSTGPQFKAQWVVCRAAMINVAPCPVPVAMRGRGGWRAEEKIEERQKTAKRWKNEGKTRLAKTVAEGGTFDQGSSLLVPEHDDDEAQAAPRQVRRHNNQHAPSHRTARLVQHALAVFSLSARSLFFFYMTKKGY